MSEIAIEMTGETVGEAKWAALRELERMRPGLDKEAVRFQVVSEGERGLLGVGYEPARVIAAVDEGSAPAREPHAAAPRDGESADAAKLREVVERIAYEIGVRCTVEIEETEEEIRVVCEGDELGTADRPPRADDRRDPVPRRTQSSSAAATKSASR